jgi:hypothetical protein
MGETPKYLSSDVMMTPTKFGCMRRVYEYITDITLQLPGNQHDVYTAPLMRTQRRMTLDDTGSELDMISRLLRFTC